MIPEHSTFLYLYQDKDGHFYGTTRKILQNGFRLLKSVFYNSLEYTDKVSKFKELVTKVEDDTQHWFFYTKAFSLYFSELDNSDASIKVVKGNVYFKDEVGDWVSERMISDGWFYIDNEGKLQQYF